MAKGSRETFKKRQKELLRAEKQRDKLAKRLAKKSARPETDVPDAPSGEDSPEVDQPGDSQSGFAGGA